VAITKKKASRRSYAKDLAKMTKAAFEHFLSNKVTDEFTASVSALILGWVVV